MTINEAALSDVAKQPILRTPNGYFVTGFMLKDDVESVADYQLMAENTRINLSTLTTADHDGAVIFGNSIPDVSASVTRDQDDHAILDITGTTDEGDGSSDVLERLGVNATGLTFEPVINEPGRFRSTTPFLGNSIPLSVSGLNEGLTNDTTDTAVNVPDKPEITNLAIDCSGPPVSGSCVAGGFPYPVNFNVADAIGCTATPEVTSGAGTAGSTSAVILNSGSGSFDYTTGSNSGNFIKITVDCNGSGGVDSDFTEFEIQ
jgi:hypothetical protein